MADSLIPQSELESLRFAVLKYQTILEQAIEMLFLHTPDGRILDINEAACRQTGYTREELLNLTVFDIDPDAGLRKDPDMIWETLDGQKKHTFESTHCRKDGTTYPVEVTLSKITFENEVYLLGLSRDLTQIKADQQTLREQEEQFRTLVERMPDGVYKTTHDGRFVEANEAMATMLGYDSREELMAIDILNDLYFQPSDRESLVLQEKRKELGVYSLKKKDGSEILVEDHGWYVYDDQGNILYHEGILRDVTERVKAEQERMRQAEELKELNATKDKFFSIIAHDLKAPFNSILGLADLLVENHRNLDTEFLDKSLQAISGAAHRTFTLLENLLLWSRSQTNRIPCNPELLYLNSLAQESIRLLRLQANRKNLKLTTHIPGNLSVFADRNMLEMILRNLLTNAIKFTPHNGEIAVTARLDASDTEITISDTGIGISAENLNKLFDIGQSFTTPGTDKEKGSGLGLILCREFVHRNHGTIRVESDPGKGSRFIVTLPGINPLVDQNP